MTEHEWLTCEDSREMLTYLGNRASDRKLRLFACAITRTVWDLLYLRHRSQRALECAEAYIDGGVCQEDLIDAQDELREHLELFHGEPVYEPSYWACAVNILDDIDLCAKYTANVSMKLFDDEAEAFATHAKNIRHQAILLRDVIGPGLFRHDELRPEWQTYTTLALARGIYDDRAFDRLPILADALQDAGCEDADILEHCRGDGPHVRGCWVVDLILGNT